MPVAPPRKKKKSANWAPWLLAAAGGIPAIMVLLDRVKNKGAAAPSPTPDPAAPPAPDYEAILDRAMTDRPSADALLANPELTKQIDALVTNNGEVPFDWQSALKARNPTWWEQTRRIGGHGLGGLDLTIPGAATNVAASEIPTDPLSVGFLLNEARKGWKDPRSVLNLKNLTGAYKSWPALNAALGLASDAATGDVSAAATEQAHQWARDTGFASDPTTGQEGLVDTGRQMGLNERLRLLGATGAGLAMNPSSIFKDAPAYIITQALDDVSRAQQLNTSATRMTPAFAVTNPRGHLLNQIEKFIASREGESPPPVVNDGEAPSFSSRPLHVLKPSQSPPAPTPIDTNQTGIEYTLASQGPVTPAGSAVDASLTAKKLHHMLRKQYPQYGVTPEDTRAMAGMGHLWTMQNQQRGEHWFDKLFQGVPPATVESANLFNNNVRGKFDVMTPELRDQIARMTGFPENQWTNPPKPPTFNLMGRGANMLGL